MNRTLLVINLTLIAVIFYLWSRPQPAAAPIPPAVRTEPITVGTASWYDYDLKGYPAYSKTNLTAASRNYPRGTFLKVCRVNGTFPPPCVVVRVNDYGPEVGQEPEREIDLSSAAFKKLGSTKLGLLNVTIQKISSTYGK